MATHAMVVMLTAAIPAGVIESLLLLFGGGVAVAVGAGCVADAPACDDKVAVSAAATVLLEVALLSLSNTEAVAKADTVVPFAVSRGKTPDVLVLTTAVAVADTDDAEEVGGSTATLVVGKFGVVSETTDATAVSEISSPLAEVGVGFSAADCDSGGGVPVPVLAAAAGV